MHEIVDGRALAQELGIGADREVGIRPEPREPPFDLAARSHRHRRFGADDGEALEMGSKLFDRLKHEAQIGVATARNTRSAPPTDGARSDENAMRPMRKLRCRSSSRRGS